VRREKVLGVRNMSTKDDSNYARLKTNEAVYKWLATIITFPALYLTLTFDVTLATKEAWGQMFGAFLLVGIVGLIILRIKWIRKKMVNSHKD